MPDAAQLRANADSLVDSQEAFSTSAGQVEMVSEDESEVGAAGSRYFLIGVR